MTVEFVERCVDAAAWQYEERHEQIFVSARCDEDGVWNTIRELAGSQISPAKMAWARKNAHLITTALMFIRHMNKHHRVDLHDTTIQISRGCDSPEWHADGARPQNTLLRTLMAPLSAGRVRHTEFTAGSCPYTNEGSGTYFSGDAMHRSPESDCPHERWFLRIRFSWETQPDAQKERDALRSWKPPSILESSMADTFHV